MLKRMIFKTWHVCDWLAKWLIMLGFMDLSAFGVLPSSGFNGLGKGNCHKRRETFKFLDLMRLILHRFDDMFHSDTPYTRHAQINREWNIFIMLPFRCLIHAMCDNWTMPITWCNNFHQDSNFWYHLMAVSHGYNNGNAMAIWSMSPSKDYGTTEQSMDCLRFSTSQYVML